MQSEEKMQEPMEQIVLSKLLVVLVCVEKYNALSGLQPLKGARTDHARMKELFGDKYKYTIITNTRSIVTVSDLKTILRQALTEVTENDYDGIITMYSGHGSKDYLLLSDYQRKN